MNTTIIALIVSTVGLLASMVFNIISARNTASRATKEIQKEIEVRSKKEGSQAAIFDMMNTNLEKIVKGNEVTNDRIYKLNERVGIVECRQSDFDGLSRQVAVVDQKADKAHARINILEHDIQREHDHEK